MYTYKLNKIIKGTILTNVAMKNHTTFGIGGPTSYLIYPNDKNELKSILKTAKKDN